MKSKRLQKVEADLRERARERTRSQQAKKTASKAEQKPAKQRQVADAPKSSVSRKKPAPKDYEPQDRPLSKHMARSAFLSELEGLASEKMKALFDYCLEPFLKLARYTTYPPSDDDRRPELEAFPPDTLDKDEEALKALLDMGRQNCRRQYRS